MPPRYDEPMKEITIRFPVSLWERIDARRFMMKLKWQHLGEELFTNWLNNSAISQNKKSRHGKAESVAVHENDWHWDLLQEIRNSGNVAALTSFEASLIASSLLVRYGPASAKDSAAIKRLAETVECVRSMAENSGRGDTGIDDRVPQQRSA